MRVFFTVDVEVWCDGWQDLDSQFNDFFTRYVYGPTSKGDYGLPYMFRVLNDYGLRGVFFIEPLFALRFGLEPLKEIVALTLEANQSAELHLHTEWIDEAITPPLPTISGKRQHLRMFSVEEQEILIGLGKKLIREAGAEQINAFRAGNFGFNVETLTALRRNEIFVDSSYNAALMGPDSGLLPGQLVTENVIHDGVHEVPMTVYYDRPGHLRQAQLCACSTREMEGLLWRALEDGREDFVILSHNFELLDKNLSRPNSVVAKRLKDLCEFLDHNRDSFSVGDFAGYDGNPSSSAQRQPLTSPAWKTALRHVEQVWSRVA